MRLASTGSRITGRRSVPRFIFNAPAEMVEPITKAHLTGRVTEISQWGCFAEVATPPAVSSVVQLRIEQDGQTFKTSARLHRDRGRSSEGTHGMARRA